jgi:hypothetical protein
MPEVEQGTATDGAPWLAYVMGDYWSPVQSCPHGLRPHREGQHGMAAKQFQQPADIYAAWDDDWTALLMGLTVRAWPAADGDVTCLGRLQWPEPV